MKKMALLFIVVALAYSSAFSEIVQGRVTSLICNNNQIQFSLIYIVRLPACLIQYNYYINHIKLYCRLKILLFFQEESPKTPFPKSKNHPLQLIEWSSYYLFYIELISHLFLKQYQTLKSYRQYVMIYNSDNSLKYIWNNLLIFVSVDIFLFKCLI